MGSALGVQKNVSFQRTLARRNDSFFTRLEYEGFRSLAYLQIHRRFVHFYEFIKLKKVKKFKKFKK